MNHPVYFVFGEMSEFICRRSGQCPVVYGMFDTYYEAEQEFENSCASLSHVSGDPGTIRLIRVDTDYVSSLILEYCKIRGDRRLYKERKELEKLSLLAECHKHGNVVVFDNEPPGEEP